MTCESEMKLLADYILAEIEGEPSENDGAGGTAVRLLRKYRMASDELRVLRSVAQGDDFAALFPAASSDAHIIEKALRDYQAVIRSMVTIIEVGQLSRRRGWLYRIRRFMERK